MLQQARGMDLPVRYLVRDLDFKYSKRFDKVFAEVGCIRGANGPASAESETRSLSVGLGRFGGSASTGSSFSGLGHLDHITSCYLDYYHQARPHQRKDNKPLARCLARDRRPA